jgi:hypothetical protein
MRMKSMESQVGIVGVVEEIIKWCDYRRAQDIRERCRWFVECRVGEDSNAEEDETESNKGKER